MNKIIVTPANFKQAVFRQQFDVLRVAEAGTLPEMKLISITGIHY